MSITLIYIRKGSEIKNEHHSPRPEQPSVIFHVLLFATSTLPSYLRWTPPLTSTCLQPVWILLTEWCKCKQTQWRRGSRRCQWFPAGPRWTPLAPLFPLAPEPPLYWRWSSPFWPPHLCVQGAYLWRNSRAMWDNQQDMEASFRSSMWPIRSLRFQMATKSAHPEARLNAQWSSTEGEISLSTYCPTASVA